MTGNREIEVKLPVPDSAKLIVRLRAIGAERVTRVHEQNTLFDTPDCQLQRLRSILRIRREQNVDVQARADTKRDRERPADGLLTFKGPVPGRTGSISKYKERQEIEYHLENAPRFARVLRSIGLRPWFQYEKYRTKYRIRGEAHLHIDLDETPIGSFLELEGSRREIDRTAKALGYSVRDYITASYLELYAADCSQKGLRVTNMVFDKKKKSPNRNSALDNFRIYS
ncbi:MAG TPA: class IV adenylate cyclase [Candidatus Acidoferrales bacterium]|nr:class IV adenylate cyclase [Candidatus Acidoferrales bacterium]